MIRKDDKRPTMRERMVAEARARSSSEGIPFTESMDMSASIEGFDSWAHYEEISSRTRSIGGAVEAMSIMAGRSQSKGTKHLFVIALLAIIARSPFRIHVPRAIIKASLPIAILLTAASIVLYAIAFMDREFIPTTSTAGMFCSLFLITLVTCGRSMVAASMHPCHRSAPRICAMTGYLLGFGMPGLCLAGLTFATDEMSMDRLLMYGLVASALAGPFWLTSVIDVLLRGEGAGR